MNLVYISHDCKSRMSCSVCMGKHHVSICDKVNSMQSDHSGRAHNSGCIGTVHSNSSGHALTDQPIGARGTMQYKVHRQMLVPLFM